MLEPDLYRSAAVQGHASCETLSFFSLPSTPTGADLLVNHLKSLEDVTGQEKEREMLIWEKEAASWVEAGCWGVAGVWDNVDAPAAVGCALGAGTC